MSFLSVSPSKDDFGDVPQRPDCTQLRHPHSEHKPAPERENEKMPLRKNALQTESTDHHNKTSLDLELLFKKTKKHRNSTIR